MTEATTTTAAPAAAATTAAPVTPAVTAQPQVSLAPAATSAAPATKTPAAATKTDRESAAPIFGTAVDYQETGNSNLDTALRWAGQMGLHTESTPEMQQAMQGNFGPLKALLASKQIPGSDAYVALAEAGFKEHQAAAQAKTQAVQQMVVDVAGDADTWAKVFDWARDNAEPAEKEQINSALAQGGFVAEAVAARLVSNYQSQSTTTVPQRAAPVKETAGARAATSDTGPLSPQAYGKAVQDLRLSLKGKPIDGTPQYAALQRRRGQFRG